MTNKNNSENEEIMNKIYDFVLDPKITDRERKVGLMAKKDLEKGRYSVAVLNQIIASLQQEAIKNRSLSPDAKSFYDAVNSILIKNKPFGTNLGTMTINRSYLD